MLKTIEQVVDLLDPRANRITNLDPAEARTLLLSEDPGAVDGIEGSFALVATDGRWVSMARTLDRPMRYFLAKRKDGPALVVADRMDRIHDWLVGQGFEDQFHPSYTRMVPAHHVLRLHLIGCPDPLPELRRFFAPARNDLPADPDVLGERYVGALYAQIENHLRRLPPDEPVGVCFSGGVDSGAVFLLTLHALLSLGMSPARLKAFTLSMGGRDLEQAREFLKALDLELYLEEIEEDPSTVGVDDVLRCVEDYKPLDVQAAAMGMILLQGIRRRYPDWKHLLDGDGGDENFKDYAIEENPELTIRSVLSNLMLYQEGWGVDSVKHSLTYSGGQSRGVVRGWAPAQRFGFQVFSPHMQRPVIRVAEAAPFIELTDWDVQRLYALKGEIVARGVRTLTGQEMPVFEKRRFQHGAVSEEGLQAVLPYTETEYRRRFHALYA